MNAYSKTQKIALAPAPTGLFARNPKPRRRPSVPGVIAFLLGLAGAAVSAQEEGTVTAYRAFDFTRAVGIRMAPADTNYRAHWTAVKNKFAPLKIKYVRLDGIPLGANSDYLGWVNELKTTSQVGGTKFNFVFGNALLSQNAMENSIDAALDTNAAFSFEGPNEYSKHWYNEDLEPAHESDDWHLYVRDFYVNFKSYLRDNGFPSGPIVGPSMWKRDQWAYTTIAGTSVPGNCTVANLHYYFPGTGLPTSAKGINHYNQPPGDPRNSQLDRILTMDECIDDAQLIKPQSAPTWITETGASIGDGDGGSGVTESQQAKYIPRLLAEFYKRRTSQNVQKIFLFEMMDSVGETYGLLDDTAAERPAYSSLKNTMTLLNDTSTAASTFTAESLTYSLNGATGVSTLLLEKGTSPRQFYLVLWKNVVSPANGSDVTQNVTLSWSGFSSPNVAVYLPLNGSGAVKTGSGNSITLSGTAAVRDHIMIVRIDKP